MKLAKRAMEVLGALTAIAMSIVLLTPKAAQAVEKFIDVEVANTSKNPVPTKAVDNPSQQPFQFFATAGFPSFSFQVPAGKTLVLEQTGLQCFEPPVSLFATDYRVEVTAGGTHGEFIFPSTTFGNDVMMNQMTRIYADGGTTVELGTGSGAPAGSFCSASLSGHLIDPF